MRDDRRRPAEITGRAKTVRKSSVPIVAAGLSISLFLFFVVPVPPDVRAQEPAGSGMMSILDAVSLSLEKYPAVGAAEADLAEAEEAVGQANAEWFPRLGVSGTASWYEEPMLAYPFHGFTPDIIPPFSRTLTSYALDLEYTLFDGGGRLYGTRMAGARRGAARASLERTRQSVVSRVVQGYLNVLSAFEITTAHRHRVAAMEMELERVRQFFGQDRAARVDVLRAEASLAAAQAEKVRADMALDVAERTLAILIGTDRERTRARHLLPVELVGVGQDDVSRDRVLETARSSNPLILESRRRSEAADAGVGLARSARLPTFFLTGSYYNQGDLESNRVTEWRAGLAVSVPVFTGGAITKRIAAARAAHRGLEERVREAEYEVRSRIDRAIASLEEARARVESLGRAVRAVEEVVNIERLLLETGAGTQTDYLDAEADLLITRAGLVEARHAELGAYVELARVAGKLDLDWIERHLENRP